MSEEFRIAPLRGEDRRGFDSGVEALDRYLRQQVTQDVRRRVGNCFVALDSAHSIAGYYTLSATSILLADLPPDVAKQLPRYPQVPAALIGRLAIDKRFRGRKLGSALIADAVLRAKQAGPAVFALVVNAKDEAVIGFYRHHAFRMLASRPSSLFLTIATADKVLSGL